MFIATALGVFDFLGVFPLQTLQLVETWGLRAGFIGFTALMGLKKASYSNRNPERVFKQRLRTFITSHLGPNDKPEACAVEYLPAFLGPNFKKGFSAKGVLAQGRSPILPKNPNPKPNCDKAIIFPTVGWQGMRKLGPYIHPLRDYIAPIPPKP